MLQVPPTFADDVLAGDSNLIFLNAKGGRGKTFLLNAVLAAARVQKLVAMAACYTGFAALDYDGGGTLHKQFGFPVKDDDGSANTEGLESTLRRESPRARLAKEAAIIVVDEVPMAGKSILEGLDQLLRGLCDEGDPNRLLPFAGKIVIMAGDFQQTSPIVKGDRASAAASWLTNAGFWEYNRDGLVNWKTLTISMRQADDVPFDDCIQEVGAGSAPKDVHADAPLGRAHTQTFAHLGRAKRAVKLPALMFRPIHSVDDAVAHAHPHLDRPAECATAGVLCTLNITVDDLNARALGQLCELTGAQEEVRVGSTCIKDYQDAEILDGVQPNEDFLQLCGTSGVPPHRLHLAVGAVCMIVRNLSPGLPNGKRVVVKKVGVRVVEVVDPADWPGDGNVANIHHSKVRFIPRIRFVWKHSRVGMSVERRQFPLRLAYAVTFNKAQGARHFGLCHCADPATSLKGGSLLP